MRVQRFCFLLLLLSVWPLASQSMDLKSGLLNLKSISLSLKQETQGLVLESQTLLSQAEQSQNKVTELQKDSEDLSLKLVLKSKELEALKTEHNALVTSQMQLIKELTSSLSFWKQAALVLLVVEIVTLLVK